MVDGTLFSPFKPKSLLECSMHAEPYIFHFFECASLDTADCMWSQGALASEDSTENY